MSLSADPAGLLLRPDARPGRGLGHVQRSLALGEAWMAQGGTASMEVPAERPRLRNLARAAGVTPVEPPHASHRSDQWVALDGYGHGVAAQDEARASGAGLALIDDHGRMGAHYADVVVDQNLGASAGDYGDDNGRLLLGPTYALLRQAFADPTLEADGPRLLVTVGGRPSPAAKAFVAEVLAKVDIEPAEVGVVGDLGALTTKRGPGVRALGHSDDLASVMTGAAVALSAAGSTVWELCRSGTAPVLVAVADNQEPVGEAVAGAGAACYLGAVDDAEPLDAAEKVERLLADEAERRRVVATGHRLVDGRGAARVVTAMRSAGVALRPAEAGDARLLWEWANDEQVRASAFDPTPIAWDEHLSWFETRLADPTTHIQLALDPGTAVPWGQVRFDPLGGGNESDVEIHLSVARESRGRGRAAPLVDAAGQRLFGERPDLSVIEARVKVDNPASIRSFDRAAFNEVGNDGQVITLRRDRHVDG